jgi:two-component system, chemotaxis family, chemotaxis protein CheY
MVSVMIVDDDKFIHKVLERIIELGGHKVVGHANNGAEAVEQFVALEKKPEIILMDERMPVMKGATATKEILKMNSNTKVIFVSADESVKSKAMEAGAVDFLTKPIRSAQLFEAIEKHTNG